MSLLNGSEKIGSSKFFQVSLFLFNQCMYWVDVNCEILLQAENRCHVISHLDHVDLLFYLKKTATQAMKTHATGKKTKQKNPKNNPKNKPQKNRKKKNTSKNPQTKPTQIDTPSIFGELADSHNKWWILDMYPRGEVSLCRWLFFYRKFCGGKQARSQLSQPEVRKRT